MRLASLAAAAVLSPASGELFLPKRAAFGSGPLFPEALNASASACVFPMRLSPATPCVTLDYGFEVAGEPLFTARASSGSTAHVVVKYAESFLSLARPLADGPFTWAAPLANSNRVETLRFAGSTTTTVTSLTQGGQRWQTLCLVSGTDVSFERLGFRATVPVVENVATDLPGSFQSSDATLNAIWSLGPRAASVACVAAQSQPPMWSADRVRGTRVPGTQPGFSYKTWNLSDYELTFETQIERGGVRLSLAFDLSSNSDGLHLHLASASTTDASLFPANSVSLADGNDFVNITTVTSYSVPFAVQDGEWLRVSLVVDSSARRLAFALNGVSVFNVSVDALPNAADRSLSGAVGFGGWQDQAAYVRNVVATDRSTRQQLYANAMTDAANVRAEFGQQSNAHGVCLDGGKRDRYLWLGDFYHTVRILGVAQSDHARDAVTGSWLYAFEYQAASGQFPGLIPISYASPMPTPQVFMNNAAAGADHAFLVFPDYSLLALLAFVSYVEYSGDTAFAKSHWGPLTRATDWIDTHRVASGLLDFSATIVAFLGPTAGVAVNCAAVQAYKGMARVATAVGDTTKAQVWNARAEALGIAIRRLLWNDKLGVFSDAEDTPDQYSVAGVAFAVTSGVATEAQARSSLTLVDTTLRPASQIGYLDSSAADPSSKISPNTNGFLLDALLQLRLAAPAAYLLTSLWKPMLNDQYASGGSWEYVGQDGAPGLGDITSLSHPWGGAATYAITNYVAGIQPTSFGFRTWKVAPQLDVVDVATVKSHVATPFGPLGVDWQRDANVLRVVLTAPLGTSGEFSVVQTTTNSTFTKKVPVGGVFSFTVPL